MQWRAHPLFLYSVEIAKLILRLRFFVESVSLRLVPQLFLTPVEAPLKGPTVSIAAYCSKSLLLVDYIIGRILGQPGQQFKTPCEA